jgi:hypothetical protein
MTSSGGDSATSARVTPEPRPTAVVTLRRALPPESAERHFPMRPVRPRIIDQPDRRPVRCDAPARVHARAPRRRSRLTLDHDREARPDGTAADARRGSAGIGDARWGVRPAPQLTTGHPPMAGQQRLSPAPPESVRGRAYPGPQTANPPLGCFCSRRPSTRFLPPANNGPSPSGCVRCPALASKSPRGSIRGGERRDTRAGGLRVGVR